MNSVFPEAEVRISSENPNSNPSAAKESIAAELAKRADRLHSAQPRMSVVDLVELLGDVCRGRVVTSRQL